jgi:hypothetical protein
MERMHRRYQHETLASLIAREPYLWGDTKVIASRGHAIRDHTDRVLLFTDSITEPFCEELMMEPHAHRVFASDLQNLGR